VTSLTERLLPALTALSLLGAPAAVQAQSPAPAEPLQAGYRLLYAGEKHAAAAHFDNLLKTNPDNVPLRYGWLMAERQRLDDAALRPKFEKAIDALIALTEKRYDKNSKDGEALFYLANSHFLRAEYRFSYDKGMWGAARDGASAKGLIEKYIKLEPGNTDAYLVLGMYNYYVDIAPTFIKFISFFLFLPGGDRVQGLKQVERAAAEGALFAPVAKTMLVEIYSEYEGRGTEALAVGEQLHKQYPTNDELSFKIAGILGGPLIEDRPRASAVYQGIIDRRRGDTTKEGASAYYNAVFAQAQLKRDEWRVADAIAALTPIIDAKVTTPDWVTPQALLARASYRNTLNDATGDEDAKRVATDPQMGPWKDRANNLIKQITDRRASGEAAVVASLIPGNRLTVEGRWDDAQRAYEPVRANNPQNPIVRYRLAYLDFSRGRLDAAMPVFTSLAAAGKSVNEQVRAQAQLYIGRIHDLGGRRADAKKAYEKVIDGFPRQGFAVNAAKVGLLTAYRRPTTAHTPGD
jgi:tetratricopeptide (TPR) repeat protein